MKHRRLAARAPSFGPSAGCGGVECPSGAASSGATDEPRTGAEETTMQRPPKKAAAADQF